MSRWRGYGLCLLLFCTTNAFANKATNPRRNAGASKKGPVYKQPTTRPQKTALKLTVLVTKAGINLRTATMTIPKGCDLSPQAFLTKKKTYPTVPRMGNNTNTKGLTSCLWKLKKLFPGARSLTIMADKKTLYKRIIKIMDAVRLVGFSHVTLSTKTP